MNSIETGDIRIFAGPCSISEQNVKDIHRIADLRADGQPAVFGTRVVGAKSRTELNPVGTGMGIDALQLLAEMEGGVKQPLPSAEIARQIVEDTNLHVATEIMAPSIQLPHFEEYPIFNGKLMVWNPAVNQLGWNLHEMNIYARKNGWQIGIKNPKWLGSTLDAADNENQITSMERTWIGLTTWIQADCEQVLIHRGYDIPEKGSLRNALSHKAAERVKRLTNLPLFLDPSHSFGKELRDKIVEETAKAMRLKDQQGTFLYDGILIEVGNSTTDNGQHITVDELRELVIHLTKFRNLAAPTREKSIMVQVYDNTV